MKIQAGEETADPRPRSSRDHVLPSPKPAASWLLFGLLAAALSLGSHLPLAGVRFDRGWEAAMGVDYAAQFARVWLDAGFLETRGQPQRFILPTRPSSGRPYVNHPVLSHWLIFAGVRLFGLNEFGLRIAPICFSAATAFMLAAFAAARLGRWGAWSIAAMIAISPATFLYGRMANYESFIVALGFAASLAFDDRDGRRSPGLALAAIMLTAAIDWTAAFVLFAMIVVDVCRRRGLRWQAILFMISGLMVSFGAYLLLVTAWTGSMTAAIAAITDAARAGHGESGLTDLGALALAQFRHLGLLLGWPATAIFCLLAPWALVRSLLGWAAPVERQIAIWTLVGITTVLAFPARAGNHVFWLTLALPALLLAMAWCMSIVASRSRLIAAILLALTLGSAAIQSRDTYGWENSGWNRERQVWADSQFDENTLFIQAWRERGPWEFHARAWVYVSEDQAEIRGVVARFIAGEFTSTRLAIWYPSFVTAAQDPELARLISHGGTIETMGLSSLLVVDREGLGPVLDH